MCYQRKMIFVVLTSLFLLTACTALRSMDGSSPEEMKKSELSKDDLWNQTKALEKEKGVCQTRLAEQAGVVSRMNSRLAGQQEELALANGHITELKRVIDGLSARIKQFQKMENENNSPERRRGALTNAWGTLMQARDKTNIRTKRSVGSRLRGYLTPDQTIKADFLRDGWYAVFRITETERSETKTLGYVYAPRLFKAPLSTEATPQAQTKGESAASAIPVKEGFSVAVKSIRHRIQPEGKEVILVEFDRFYVPAVYNIEGDTPMIIIDVTRTYSMKKEWSEIRTGGALIKKIRVNLNRSTDILRIVMDMTPDKDYDIKPTFYTGKENKVYALEVTGVPPKN